MGRPIRVRVGSVWCDATLFDDLAPRTVAALWPRLPIRDRTIQARWSGDAWRTDGNYELLTRDDPVENPAERLAAGDIIYYPGYRAGLFKIAIAYGAAQWLAPFRVPLAVSRIGRIETNLDIFVAACQRIILDGPLELEIIAP